MLNAFGNRAATAFTNLIPSTLRTGVISAAVPDIKTSPPGTGIRATAPAHALQFPALRQFDDGITGNTRQRGGGER